MTGMATRKVLRGGVWALGIALVFGGVGYAMMRHAGKVSRTLTPTVAAPTAHGKAKLSLKSSKNGRFVVAASHLKGGTSYQLIVGGVKVGTIQTTKNGHGKVLFSTTPGANSSVLGFDPRGDQVLVRDAQGGDDVLVGDMPDDDPNSIACCLADPEEPGQSECEDLTADQCTAANGAVQQVASCLPDPCATTPPSGGVIVCCTNATGDDESEAECEEVATSADCAAVGGMAVQATSCDPNPCQVTPPVNTVACCIPQTSDDGEMDPPECEVVSADTCMAAGGTASTATTCEPDPCQSAPSPNTSACCIPHTENGQPSQAECEVLSADACATAGGMANTATTCEPDPCNPSSGGGN